MKTKEDKVFTRSPVLNVHQSRMEPSAGNTQERTFHGRTLFTALGFPAETQPVCFLKILIQSFTPQAKNAVMHWTKEHV